MCSAQILYLCDIPRHLTSYIGFVCSKIEVMLGAFQVRRELKEIKAWGFCDIYKLLVPIVKHLPLLSSNFFPIYIKKNPFRAFRLTESCHLNG